MKKHLAELDKAQWIKKSLFKDSTEDPKLHYLPLAAMQMTDELLSKEGSAKGTLMFGIFAMLQYEGREIGIVNKMLLPPFWDKGDRNLAVMAVSKHFRQAAESDGHGG